jgi:hypothetical protein
VQAPGDRTMPSIYRPKHSVLLPEADVAHGAHINTHETQCGTSNDQSEWVGRRKAQPAEVLLPSTRRWLDSLPVESRPQALVKQYPRLANLFAANWSSPGDCSEFIYSLLHDQRGGRRGFPREVIDDISSLRMYYARLHPIADWEANADRDRYRRR